MNPFSSLLIGIPVFVILLGPLLFVHELGHFVFAKLAGIRVEEFGIGFPPRTLTLFRWSETAYTLNWLPIGAFVRMAGEEDPSDPRSFAAQPKRWRFLVLFGGPAMNFVFAVIVLWVSYMLFATQPATARYRITAVNSGSPAAQIGLLPGDVVVSANGVDATEHLTSNRTQDTFILKEQARASVGKPFSLVVLRKPEGSPDARPAEVTLSGVIPATTDPQAPLGVRLGLEVLTTERVYYTPGEALTESLADLYSTVRSLVRAPFDLIAGQLTPEQVRPVSIVGITSIGVSLLEQGAFPFIRFAGLLSMLIGLTNLLPLPALDGGRIVFVLLEWVRGRRVDPKREQWVHGVGMVVLLALSAVIIVLDIVNPVVLP